MKKALTIALFLCAVAVSAQTLVAPTCHNHGLKGPVHIVQTSWFYDTGDGYAIGNTGVEIYDTSGRLLHALEMSQDGEDDNVHYTYDGLGRLSTETHTLGEPYTDAYHYGTDGRMVFIVRKFGEDYSQYDDTMRVRRYDSQGRPVELMENGRPCLYRYWPNGEIRQVSEQKPNYNIYYNEYGQLDSVISQAGLLYYRFNSDGLMVSEDNHTGTFHFHSEFTDYIIDSHGNWINRSVNSNDGTKSFVRRTIIYYKQ